jgi:hypothetical protein
LTRWSALLVLAALLSACANDYDQFSFVSGAEHDAASEPRGDVWIPEGWPDSSPRDARPDEGIEAGSREDAGLDALADTADAPIDAADAGADGAPDDALASDAGDADAPTELDAAADVPIVEDAGDGGPGDDGANGDDGAGDAGVDASIDEDAPDGEDVSIDGSIGEDASDADASVDGSIEEDVSVGNDAVADADAACGPCHLPHASSRCDDGKCVIETCDAGFEDCNLVPDDGCEVSLLTDVFHCGACGRECSDLHVLSRECMAGVCVSTCAPGFGNCERPGQGPDDGCERAVSMDNANCGSCGNSCLAQGGGLTCGALPSLCGCTDNASCRMGGSNGSCNSEGLCKCGPATCHRGEACLAAQGPDTCSCNGGPACADGETCCDLPAGCHDLLSDPSSCGACGHACPIGLSCFAGSCVCTSDAQCDDGGGGTCAAGQCVCSGTPCAVGQRCLPGGRCG